MTTPYVERAAESTKTESEVRTESLITWLEKATGPDRKLDGAIWAVVDPDAYALCRNTAVSFSPKGFTEAEIATQILNRAKRLSPEYTASIDAALTLVPAGYYWFIASGRWQSEEPMGAAQIADPENPDFQISEAEHDSPIIALVIAALQARVVIAKAKQS